MNGMKAIAMVSLSIVLSALGACLWWVEPASASGCGCSYIGACPPDCGACAPANCSVYCPGCGLSGCTCNQLCEKASCPSAKNCSNCGGTCPHGGECGWCASGGSSQCGNTKWDCKTDDCGGNNCVCAVKCPNKTPAPTCPGGGVVGGSACKSTSTTKCCSATGCTCCADCAATGSGPNTCTCWPTCIETGTSCYTGAGGILCPQIFPQCGGGYVWVPGCADYSVTCPGGCCPGGTCMLATSC